MSDVPRSYTPAEKRKRAWLVLRGAKQALADNVDPKLDARIDRIDAQAEDRGIREARALYQQHEQAQNALAAAKAKERTASREDRQAARQARIKAEQQLSRTQKAIRRAGL
ncbi:hypothetical protein [Streptomyces asiaticus]|uniref:hypothetical protein n=1 Tax=Streptomyces asiaticus TaxID=114695 RepID=UPI003F674EB8